MNKSIASRGFSKLIEKLSSKIIAHNKNLRDFMIKQNNESDKIEDLSLRVESRRLHRAEARKKMLENLDEVCLKSGVRPELMIDILVLKNKFTGYENDQGE